MSALSDRLQQRARELVERAEFVRQMEDAGEGSSALVELAAIEDEMLFIRSLMTAGLLELIKARHDG